MKYIFSFFVLFLLLTSSVSADIAMTDSGSMMVRMGPTIGGRMLHAWVSLIAAVVIFFLALKYLARGALARPIFLIGLGALVDAFLGLFPPAGDHTRFMWFGALIFSTSVVLGIVWMAQIFGVFQRETKAQK